MEKIANIKANTSGKIKIRTETSEGYWTEQELNHIHDDVIRDIDMMLTLNEPTTIFEHRREIFNRKYLRHIAPLLKIRRIEIKRFQRHKIIITLH